MLQAATAMNRTASAARPLLLEQPARSAAVECSIWRSEGDLSGKPPNAPDGPITAPHVALVDRAVPVRTPLTRMSCGIILYDLPARHTYGRHSRAGIGVLGEAFLLLVLPLARPPEPPAARGCVAAAKDGLRVTPVGATILRTEAVRSWRLVPAEVHATAHPTPTSTTGLQRPPASQPHEVRACVRTGYSTSTWVSARAPSDSNCALALSEGWDPLRTPTRRDRYSTTA
ncbi:hypothetical protein CERZMDRAFT_87876 [Cercospora zeae-maydis SCOH1-5]|uniref:Uncharacterized protein n=1 Tax=Cercospora zeae-maydis SCOH1-5 TaxID=717836 RepID=A0A6A6F2G1_9PEZI|nr:hypothetical protein CERZMDRAFT_87876 [Cercospora zeae-maydis SCOH1-5]